VFMFSIFTTCQLIRREQNLEHSIGLALFFGLCIYPYWVYDIGFQLSYLAVISIVYFLPMFKNYYSNNKVVKYLQGIVYVSLSVQIGLIPIQLYYFHQFSFVFLLANLVVIPLATVLVIVGMLYLSTMWIGGVSNVVGWFFSRFTDLLYYSIASINKINYLSFSGIKISPLQLLFIITPIILVALAYYRQKLRYVIICLVFGIIVQGSSVFINENCIRSEVEVVIPYISGKRDLTVWVKEEQTLTIFSKQWDTLKRFAQDNYVQEHAIREIVYHGLEGIIPSTITDILVLDNDQVDYDLPFDTTIVVVANHPKVNFERMLEMRTPSLVVFHNSVPFWFKQKCMVICLKKNIPFHDIYEKGYWSSLL
ncbi:MAG: ComEC/Rec2 family competence protein, partial [Flavobacterium sp.]